MFPSYITIQFTGQYTMYIPTGELHVILTEIDGILNSCRTNETEMTSPSPGADLITLAQALEQLADVMTRVEGDIKSGGNTTAADITEIGAYALQLQEALAAACEKQSLPEQQQPLALLAINMALWIAQHSGQIELLEPVANAIALLANKSRDPADLGKLSGVISTIIAAVAPVISQDLEKMNAGRPWRVLLLNHSIVATRSHDTGLMEAAFALLTSNLPEDATRFFSEGMEQMEALDYPAHVRAVMQKYHSQWPANRSLH